MVPILGGSVRGLRLNGEVLAAGADFQVLRHDGVLELEARYLLRLDDGALVYVNNRGIRTGEASGPPGHTVYFRTTPTFETTSPHDWLQRTMFVGTGERKPDSVTLRIFQF